MTTSKEDLLRLGTQALERRKKQAEASAARRAKLKAEGKTALTLTVSADKIESIKKIVAVLEAMEPGSVVCLSKQQPDGKWTLLEPRITL